MLRMAVCDKEEETCSLIKALARKVSAVMV